MALEAIAAQPIVEKLRNLRQYLPDQNEVVYDFGAFLAERLEKHPNIIPVGFNVMAELGIYDLQRGIDGFTDKPITSRLVGYPSQIYTLFKMIVPDIAKATCPEDFAKEVKEMYDIAHK